MVKWKKHLQLENASYGQKFGIVNMTEISVHLGHKSVDVSERVYAKYFPKFMKESANVMGILFLETGANSIIWEMRRLYSPKSLILNDLIGTP